MISRIRSHSCQVTLSQTSTQLTGQFINICNLKLGSTWACICEIELLMTSITEGVIVSWDIHTFIAGVMWHKLMHAIICAVLN